MFTYILYCVPVFFSAVLVLSTKHSPRSSELIADVIKNISQVNSVLQDLIHNYERLQNMYQSKEIIETTKQFKNDIFKYDKKSYMKFKNAFPATTAWSDLDGETTQISKYDKRTGKSQRAKNQNAPHSTSSTTLSDLLIMLSSSDNEDNASNNSMPIKKAKINHKIANLTTKKKTRFFVLNSKNTTRIRTTYKKTDAFSTNNRYKQSTKNKYATVVIHLETKRPHHNKTHYTFRGNVDNNTDLTATNKTTTNETTPVETKNISAMIVEEKNRTESADLSNDREDWTSALRKAYGDACLKLVIKKCYKACKLALKSACKNCENEYNVWFDKYSRIGCIESFQPVFVESSTAEGLMLVEEETKIETSRRNYAESFPKKERVENDSNDYLSAVCKPIYRRMTAANTRLHSNKTSLESKLSMLRHKYEKACVDSSRKRCTDACQHAYRRTCAKHECKIYIVHRFEKACNRKCKSAYYITSYVHRLSSSSHSSSSRSEMSGYSI